MGLPSFWKIVAFNASGVSIAINGVTVKLRLFKPGSSGEKTYAAETTLQNAASIGNNAEGDVGGQQDNTAAGAGYWGFEGTAEVTTTGTPNGDVSIWLKGTTASTGSYATERRILLGVLNFTAAATKRIDIAVGP